MNVYADHNFLIFCVKNPLGESVRTGAKIDQPSLDQGSSIKLSFFATSTPTETNDGNPLRITCIAKFIS